MHCAIYCRSLSSHAMALRLNKSLTEMSTRNLPRGKEQPMCKDDNLTYWQVGCLENMSLDVSQPYRPPWPITGVNLLFAFT
jgi:hypothetical protein